MIEEMMARGVDLVTIMQRINEVMAALKFN